MGRVEGPSDFRFGDECLRFDTPEEATIVRILGRLRVLHGPVVIPPSHEAPAIADVLADFANDPGRRLRAELEERIPRTDPRCDEAFALGLLPWRRSSARRWRTGWRGFRGRFWRLEAPSEPGHLATGLVSMVSGGLGAWLTHRFAAIDRAQQWLRDDEAAKAARVRELHLKKLDETYQHHLRCRGIRIGAEPRTLGGSAAQSISVPAHGPAPHRRR